MEEDGSLGVVIEEVSDGNGGQVISLKLNFGFNVAIF